MRHHISRLIGAAILIFTMLSPALGLDNERVGVDGEQETRLETTVSLTKEEIVAYHAEQMKLDKNFVLNLHKLDAKLFCMAQNNFFEARGETMLGKVAISEVVANRVESELFPKDVCSVVRQSTSLRIDPTTSERVCQFSWYCTGKGRIPLVNSKGDVDQRVYGEWYDSVVAAMIVYKGSVRVLVEGATHFYAHRTVKPGWSRRLSKVNVIGNHTFMAPRVVK
jgi:spore germination cell wall hydrolase CwlJ-like protein